MAHATLLLNWIYYRPVGHAVEAFAAAADYTHADADLEVHVVINSHSTDELGGNCPWVNAVYGVDVDEVVRDGSSASCLRGLPKTWDLIVRVGKAHPQLPVIHRRVSSLPRGGPRGDISTTVARDSRRGWRGARESSGFHASCSL